MEGQICCYQKWLHCRLLWDQRGKCFLLLCSSALPKRLRSEESVALNAFLLATDEISQGGCSSLAALVGNFTGMPKGLLKYLLLAPLFCPWVFTGADELWMIFSIYHFYFTKFFRLDMSSEYIRHSAWQKPFHLKNLCISFVNNVVYAFPLLKSQFWLPLSWFSRPTRKDSALNIILFQREAKYWL